MCKDCPPPSGSDFIHELLNVLEETLNYKEGPPPGFKETEFSHDSIIESFRSIIVTCKEAIDSISNEDVPVEKGLEVAGKAYYQIARSAEHNRGTVREVFLKMTADKSKEN